MKVILVLASLLIVSFQSVAQGGKTFILVRHAEKQSSVLADPELTEKGQGQSRALSQLLAHIQLTGAYSTPYIRTQNTLEPVAKKQNLQIDIYQPMEGNELLASLINSKVKLAEESQEEQHYYLISGHSNTIPAMVNFLMKYQAVGPMPETDYGKVFIVQTEGKLTPKLLILQLPE